MRRPTSSSIHSSYRPIFQSIGNADDQRDGSASLARRLSIRERNRRALNDNLIFNPMRRPRDRLYQELAERHRAARARAQAASEPKLEREEKPIWCSIFETDGGSYQSSTGVKNVCSDDSSVYCSYKRNNVNILFEHANSTAPFELTRIVVKTPSIGYSSPVREGLVYISMSPISFKDTEQYDRIDETESPSSSLFDHIGINCLEGRRESASSTLTRKESSTTGPSRTSVEAQPVIPQWGSLQSGNRVETEPIAKFQISRQNHSTEIMFNPPITGRFILMKLFNNIVGEHSETEPRHRQPDQRREYPSRTHTNPLRDEPPAVGDPLRFDIIDDELEEHESAFGDSQDGDLEFENVDVQAILFYGHTGRRRFPIIQTLWFLGGLERLSQERLLVAISFIGMVPWGT